MPRTVPIDTKFLTVPISYELREESKAAAKARGMSLAEFVDLALREQVAARRLRPPEPANGRRT